MNRLSRMSERAKRGLILLLAASMILCGDIPLYAASSVSGDQAYAEQTPDGSEPEEGISSNEEKPSRDTEVSGNTPTEKESDSEEPKQEVSEDSVSENVTEEEGGTVSGEQTPEESGNASTEEIVVGSEVSENGVSDNQVSENKTPEIVDNLPKNENELQVLTEKAKATIDKNGRVVVTWKAVKKAKKYRVDRQNADGTWITVREPASSKKFIDSSVRLGGQTSETYLYRIVPYGTDVLGTTGYGRPGYALCAPVILSAQARTISDNDLDYYIGVDFTTIKGAAEYEIQHAYKKNKDYIPAAVVSNLNGKGKAPYSGTVVSTYNGQSVLTESYLDGTDFTLNYKDTYYYRVRASVEVDGQTVYSAFSKAVKARVTVRAPRAYMAESLSYNSAIIYWEDMQNIGENDSYYIYKSTKPNTGFKKAKAVKRWQLQSVSMNFPGMTVSGQTVDCLAYEVKGLKSEIPYYFKVVAVKDKLAGAYSEAVTATPMLTDVTGLSVNSANYNKMTISFNAVPGATKYYIYEAGGLTVDKDGKAGPPSEWRFVNKPITCTKKPKNGVVTYTRSGLTKGVYYGYYVLPVRGKVHNTPVENREYGYDFTRMAKPKLTATAQNLYSIKVSWNQASGATGYQLEYSTDENFSSTATDRRSMMFSKYGLEDNKKVFTNRTFTLSNLTPGVKYYFRVTAYKFTKAEYARQEYGLAGEPSDVVCEWGRPQAVKNLKAEFDENRPREGATLTWTKSSETDVKYYKVVRSVYEYDTAKEKVGKLESERIVLVDALDKYTKTSYKDTERVENGKYIKYEVCGYYAPSGLESDRWIEGKYASAVYMNPSAIKITDKIKVQVGKTYKPSVTFVPKASTNKALQWTILTSGGSSYITVDNTTGQIKGLKKTKSKEPVEVEVTSRNDSSVRATFKVTVTEEQQNPTGNLVVCLDPGHGGSDSGAGYGSLVEKRINLETSQYTKERLEAYGVKVYMTRSSDVYVGLEARTKFAKDNGCNLFVSQHMNSGGGSGTEVYYSLNSSCGRRDLAAKISSKVSASLGIPNRGAKTRQGQNGDYYSVIRTSASYGIPGMIVEGAFLDGNSNVAGNSRAIGYATADAILEYYGYK